jgi:hypothetical protein
MRNYWLKIILGALAVFAVGMAGISATRAVLRKAHGVAEGTDPISIPLSLFPFRVGGTRVGTFDRIVLLRKSPNQVSGIDLRVRITDTMALRSLKDCALLANLPQGAGGVRAVDNVDFVCVRGDSTPFPAESVGHVTLLPGHHRVPLLVSREIAAALRKDDASARAQQMADSISGAADRTADSTEEAMSRMSDSLSAMADRMADSITALHEARADSVRASALRTADSVRRRARVIRDSVRAALHPR